MVKFSETKNIHDLERGRFAPTSNDDIAVRFISEDSGSLLAGLTYDEIQAQYPTGEIEVYRYLNAAVLQATITVTYVDSTKDQIISVVRS